MSTHVYTHRVQLYCTALSCRILYGSEYRETFGSTEQLISKRNYNLSIIRKILLNNLNPFKVFFFLPKIQRIYSSVEDWTKGTLCCVAVDWTKRYNIMDSLLYFYFLKKVLNQMMDYTKGIMLSSDPILLKKN